MATQNDIDELDRAIGSGALRVRFADGREVTYRSMDEMERARTKLVGLVSGGAPFRRTTVAGF